MRSPYFCITKQHNEMISFLRQHYLFQVHGCFSAINIGTPTKCDVV